MDYLLERAQAYRVKRDHGRSLISGTPFILNLLLSSIKRCALNKMCSVRGHHSLNELDTTLAEPDGRQYGSIVTCVYILLSDNSRCHHRRSILLISRKFMPAIDSTTHPNAQNLTALVTDEKPGSPCVLFRTLIPANAGRHPTNRERPENFNPYGAQKENASPEEASGHSKR